MHAGNPSRGDNGNMHRFGKLSLEAFRRHIGKSLPARTADPRLPAAPADRLVRFCDRLPTLKQAEQLLIEEALQRAEGNQAVAAMHLGITRQALNRRLRKGRRHPRPAN